MTDDIKIKRRILSARQTNCYYVFRDGSELKWSSVIPVTEEILYIRM